MALNEWNSLEKLDGPCIVRLSETALSQIYSFLDSAEMNTAKIHITIKLGG